MGLIVQNKLAVNFDGATYTLSLPGFELQVCSVRLLTGDGVEHSLCWMLSASNAARLEYRCENELGTWRLEFLLHGGREKRAGIEIAFDGVLRSPIAGLRMITLHLPEISCSHVLSQGVAMGGCQSLHLPVGAASKIEGHYQLMLSRPGHHLQMSFPLQQPQPASFTMEVEGSAARNVQAVTVISHYGNLEVKAPVLRITSAVNGFALMEAWADENTEQKKDFSSPVRSGWNSWDYYRWTITENEVLRNAECIARDPVLSKHVKRIVIDDGWAYCYGEWEANSLFPSGMAVLARELTRMGFEPGLWLAPTIVEPHCRIAQTGYDMLARGESGLPCLAYECMRRYGFVLDPTQEKVQKHLAAVFSRYADMGYKHFKLDFLGATLKARRFADASVPRSQIMGKIVGPIRDVLQGRAGILGCNYHFNGGNTYIDAVRTGGDIHATWKAVRHNVTSVAARFWANKRLWVNDPDFALCRGFDTSDDPDLTRLLPGIVFVTPERTATEVDGLTAPLADLRRPQLEILLSIVLAAGGAVNLSDNLSLLNANGLDLARRVVSAESGAAAIPLDLFETEKPSVWLQKLENGHRVLLINWTDQAEERSFDLNAHGIKAKSAADFWHDTPVAVDNGVIRTNLQPRSCLLAFITRMTD